ncbi:hypothetical protein KKP89_00920, partial [Methanothermococcus sp. SCGC AD-155-N22]|nr:hypothetical protein [Methanothermococcus sp. SCGC AD-155-N22]
SEEKDREKKPKIVIDHREKNIGKLLFERAELEFKNLEFGDYILSDRVVVERKTSEDLLTDVYFIITDTPITQQLIDRFFNNVNSNLVIIGRETHITKKPPNLKILKYEDVM